RGTPHSETICPTKDETVVHFLVRCPAHEPHRSILKERFIFHAKSVAKLLTDHGMIPQLMRYIDSTGRFKDTFGAGRK
ncbi:hypothetical protein BU17DRAFT_14391, partial [Hysterangium stoloniferum]